MAEVHGPWSNVTEFNTITTPWPSIEIQKIIAGDPAASDWFGVSVALNATGDIALIGAANDDENGISNSGSVYVFVKMNGVWTPQQKLTASDAAADNTFGGSLALNAAGDMALVGADGFNPGSAASAGAVYVFTRSGTVWTQQQKLTASDFAASDRFGVSVALNAAGDIALIGALGDNNGSLLSAGSVYVFTYSGGSFTEQQKLVPNDAAASDRFGAAVALNAAGDLALISAYADDAAPLSNTGSVYVFTRVGSVWTQGEILTASDAATNDYFGVSVALNAAGDLALVGSHFNDVGAVADCGAVYVFKKITGIWTEQQKLSAADAVAGAQFGRSVALDANGNQALIGAFRDSGSGVFESGAVYVFV